MPSIGDIVTFVVNNLGYIIAVSLVAAGLLALFRRASGVAYGGGPAIIAELMTYVIWGLLSIGTLGIILGILLYSPWVVTTIFNAAVTGSQAQPAPRYAADFVGEWVEETTEVTEDTHTHDGSNICPANTRIPKGTPYRVLGSGEYADKWLVSKYTTWAATRLTGLEKSTPEGSFCETKLSGATGTVYVSPPD